MEKPVALVTGCSSGIGRDLVARLRERGYFVAASARSLESIKALGADLHLELDVADLASVRGGVSSLLECAGRLDVLVNNAGFAISAAVEELEDEALRSMLEVNVLGALRMIRAVAPAMRAAGRGVIVNVGSIAGLMSSPVGGGYCASKFALEALSDAARQELAPFGVRVLLVEPGPIATDFDARNRALSSRIVGNKASPYFELYRANEALAASMRGKEPGPEVVSEAILRAVDAKGGRARRYAGVPFMARLLIRLPSRLRDAAWAGALKDASKKNHAV